MRGATVAFALLSVAIAGCGNAARDQLRARAAFDLSCEESKIAVVEIDALTRDARGCGQQATYVESCSGAPSARCTWVPRTESRPSEGLPSRL